MIITNLNKKVSALLGILLLSSSLWAQPQGGGPPPPKPPTEAEIMAQVNELSTQLSLSNSQRSHLTDLFTAHFKELRQEMEKGQKAHEIQRQTMDARRAEFEKQIKAILTGDQIKAFEAFEKEHRPPQPQQPQRSHR